jgi:hypothetical protein
MNIKDDYYYISELDKKLIEKGLASLDVYSVHLEGYYSEEVNTKIKNIVEMLNEKFLIYQYEKKEDGSYICKYSDNWDLFFWHNGNLQYPFTDTRFNFNNAHRSYEERKHNLEQLIEILKDYQEEAVTVKIQYTTSYHEKEIEQIADSIYQNFKDTFIYFMGYEGKIKPVPNYKDGYYGSNCKYGFFKKGSKRKYYQITNMDILKLA